MTGSFLGTLFRRVAGISSAALASARTAIHRAARALLVSGVARVLAAGGLLAAVAVGALWGSFAYVPPGTVGVKQREVGVSVGLDARDLGAGLHVAPRGWSRVHLLPAGVQVASFGFESEGALMPALEVRTTDGNTPKVHAQVVFGLIENGAHGAVAAGLKHAWVARARSRIEKVLSDEISRMGSEDLMDPARLVALESRCHGALDRDLESLFVEVRHVLVNGVYFPGPFETKLREKQLEGQAVRTDASLARRARVKTENAMVAHEQEVAEREFALELERGIEEVRFELENLIATERREANDTLHGLELEAQGSYDRAVAEAELALARADARRQELLGQTLQGVGGRRLIATEIAETLRLDRITVDSARGDLGPLSPDPWIAWLEGGAGNDGDE